MKLAWSHLPIADRDEIFDHVQADSPRAAIALDEGIGNSVRRLTDFPQIGRPGRVAGTRELVINRSPYVAADRIVGATVVILRILHGSRTWPEDLSD